METREKKIYDIAFLNGLTGGITEARRVRFGSPLSNDDNFLTFITEKNEFIYISKADLRFMVPAETEPPSCEEDCFKLYPLAINKKTVVWKEENILSNQRVILRKSLYENKVPKNGSWVYDKEKLELINLEEAKSFLFTYTSYNKPQVPYEEIFRFLGFHKSDWSWAFEKEDCGRPEYYYSELWEKREEDE